MTIDTEKVKVELSAFEVEWLMLLMDSMDDKVAANIHDKLHPPLYEYKMAVEEAGNG